MPTLRELSDALWTGRTTTANSPDHPFAMLAVLEELAPGIGFYKDFSNQGVVKTAEGLVLIDTGSYNPLLHTGVFQKIRAWSADRVRLAIYTHGHADHAYGLPPFLREHKAKGWPEPQIVAHENVNRRFDRYNATADFNSIINSRQFGRAVQFPKDAIRPHVTYPDQMNLLVGGQRIELHHAKGETDDHTWVFLTAQRILFTGDLFIWAAPNAGNPQKVQRFAKEWADALRAMAAKRPVLLLPGHGLPIFGEDRVQSALLDTALYLETIHSHALQSLNRGLSIYEAIATLRVPEDLSRKPYLLAVYDEPEFILRNIYRLYGGWYSGVPSELKPATPRQLGREVARLAGGAGKLAARARELAGLGDLALACHLADWAADAEPKDKEVHAIRAEVYAKRTAAESSTMSKGIFGAAARESKTKS